MIATSIFHGCEFNSTVKAFLNQTSTLLHLPDKAIHTLGIIGSHGRNWKHRQILF